MCKHHWMLGQTREGFTPARCKKCGEERVFHAKDMSWADGKAARAHPLIQPSKLDRATMLPFNPDRYTPRKGWSNYRGTRL